ncbi:MAG TPA: hypothetical protein VJ729_00435 [Nitrososphaeraceae archaeon]|nr:hypothetical protein [Nitrososphaeraceae archaeon]
MPELWVKYGVTDVVLNIRYENLLKHITASSFVLLSEEQIKSSLNGVMLTQDTMIFALSDTKSTAMVISILVQLARAQGIPSIRVCVLPRIQHVLRSNLADRTISIGQIDQDSFHSKIKCRRQVIFVSQITYDPLFGYNGTPTVLVRNYMHENMLEALNARKENLPKPGVIGPPLDVVLCSNEELPAKSIQIIANSFGIAGISYGSIVGSFEDAIRRLNSIAVMNADSTKSAIISASSETGPHSTLLDSLNSLWNIIQVIKESGSAVLLSENSGGLGGRALEMFVEGRLDIEEYTRNNLSEYIEGLEHLIYIKELSQKYQLGIMSTLPHYYLTKLGMKTYGGVKNVIEELLVKHGKNTKILVVSDPDILHLGVNPYPV